MKTNRQPDEKTMGEWTVPDLLDWIPSLLVDEAEQLKQAHNTALRAQQPSTETDCVCDQINMRHCPEHSEPRSTDRQGAAGEWTVRNPRPFEFYVMSGNDVVCLVRDEAKAERIKDHHNAVMRAQEDEITDRFAEGAANADKQLKAQQQDTKRLDWLIEMLFLRFPDEEWSRGAIDAAIAECEKE